METSKHIKERREYTKGLKEKNNISSILFDRHKEKTQKELIEKFANIYDTGIKTIEAWEKEIEVLDKPDGYNFQEIEGTNKKVKVNTYSGANQKKLTELSAKLENLHKLFQTAYESSKFEDYEALHKFLTKNPIKNNNNNKDKSND